MSPSRGPMMRALWVACSLGSLFAAVPASAQFYEQAGASIDLSPGPLQRSPRLLGMGRLTLADDPHNRITLWDFAGDPTGILDADSTSTLLLWPGTASRSGTHDLADDPRQREHLAAREVRTDYELWRRTENNAYGFFGHVASLRLDRPFDDDTEQRGEFQGPRVVGVLNGRMPYFHSGRMRYAVHARYETEAAADAYRSIYQNASGQYIGKKTGTVEDPPDLFTPDEIQVSTVGGGVGVSYRFGSWMLSSVGGDLSSSHIAGENSSPIHLASTDESRPYYNGRASLIGSVGSHVEWGATGRVWTSAQEQDWAFTIQTGIAQALTGRGLLLTRDEWGREGRARVRWVVGPLVLGASSRVTYQAVTITPPDSDDATSLNQFLNFVTNRFGISSGLPDSVIGNHSEDRAWDVAFGGSWRLPRDRGVAGVEYHQIQNRFEQELSGVGPSRKAWDVRGGLEYACTAVMKGRLGYIYRSDDRDEATLQNEYVSHTATAGLGLAPRASIWSVEAGYVIEWLQPDFPDPSVSRESRQRLAFQVGWRF